jgi:ABC-type antimicrobial peptide transport system permease subunit
MTFFTVVVRGLIRRPIRTGLTILGISVGIAAVVALVGISRGFSKSWETGMKARGTDVVVSNMGSSLTPKPFGASVRDRIAHLEITGNQDKINVIDIRVTPSTSTKDVERLCEQINRLVPEGRAMLAGDHISNSQAYRIAQAMSWGTSLLAVLVGVLGVMNTMLMTVFERTQEICVLLALGWKRRGSFAWCCGSRLCSAWSAAWGAC